MKNKFQTFALLIFSFFTLNSWAQQGQLRVDVNAYSFEEDDCFQLVVDDKIDTVYVQILCDWDELNAGLILIDSLDPGEYLVSLNKVGVPSDELFQSATRMVEIRSGQIAEIGFYMNLNTDYTELDDYTNEEIVRSRNEIQFEFSYFDFRWNPDGNNPKFNLGSGINSSYWNSFSKHVGFLLGGGIGFAVAPLRIDSLENSSYPEEIKSSYYSYIYAQYDMKLRFSLLNQQRRQIQGHNVFLDIGAAYNLPLYFKRVTRFNIQNKLVNSFIHQFSDVRLYANLGVANFQVFASYRPFNFVGKDFPEFPRYNLGVKFNVHF